MMKLLALAGLPVVFLLLATMVAAVLVMLARVAIAMSDKFDQDSDTRDRAAPGRTRHRAPGSGAALGRALGRRGSSLAGGLARRMSPN